MSEKHNKKRKLLDGSEITHGTFGEILRTKVSNGKIGSWHKTKRKDGSNVE